MKLLFIIGTRPEAIKLAPLMLLAPRFQKDMECKICATGQHRQMLDQVLGIFDLVPDIDLNLMRPDQTLSDITGRLVVKLGEVLDELTPDILLIQGDTTTVMAAALAAFYRKIPVGHVEAGLRTETLYSPFPEEMNRRVVSVLTHFHFAPTARAQNALMAESVNRDRIFVTGNTGIDALRMILGKPMPEKARHILEDLLPSGNHSKLILVTAHRRENFGKPFENICKGLKALAERNRDTTILYPVHMNPRVRGPVFEILKNTPNIQLIDPVEYDVMAHLMKSAWLILTDSGGIQEEAPALGKPVLVLRTETERPEAVEAGVAKLIGPNPEAIVKESEKLLYNPDSYQKMARKASPYGDGFAAERILDIITN